MHPYEILVGLSCGCRSRKVDDDLPSHGQDHSSGFMLYHVVQCDGFESRNIKSHEYLFFSGGGREGLVIHGHLRKTPFAVFDPSLAEGTFDNIFFQHLASL